ncbi:hypothetical protein [Gracilibacillus alcaliphilus]|uniref:hypothetical protein n=1 Tax=Gracilibacillus alcaliphilus TaxID=1401441 RepID=UPI00195982D3|nr:hypothetical protein [Gracilibacillus alcaliphilus]MBM7677778.1 hypothetical protein [Gracilibacillus alcaliphilus]
MVTSLYMVLLTILLTFLVLSALEKISSRRKKQKEAWNVETANAQVQPVIAGKEIK